MGTTDKKRKGLPKPRDPFWRLRRVLTVRRDDGPKAYDRAERRRAERTATRAPEAADE